MKGYSTLLRSPEAIRCSLVSYPLHGFLFCEGSPTPPQGIQVAYSKPHRQVSLPLASISENFLCAEERQFILTEHISNLLLVSYVPDGWESIIAYLQGSPPRPHLSLGLKGVKAGFIFQNPIPMTGLWHQNERVRSRITL